MIRKIDMVRLFNIDILYIPIYFLFKNFYNDVYSVLITIIFFFRKTCTLIY